jgi:predicted nucleic acid-binding Zn ribbon protein
VHLERRAGDVAPYLLSPINLSYSRLKPVYARSQGFSTSMTRWSDTVMTEWRRYREPRDTERRTSGFADALRGLLPKLGLGNSLDEHAVRRAWSGLVGAFIASQSEPDRIRSGVLYVRVHQSGVRFELERVWKADIETKLAEQFGSDKIRSVKFFS